MFCRLFVVCIALVFATAGADAKRVALVIGNNGHQELRPLDKAVNDDGAIRDFMVSTGHWIRISRAVKS